MTASMPAPREPEDEDASADLASAPVGGTRPVQALPSPVGAKPAAKMPVARKPAAKKPATKNPAAKKPAAKKPVAKAPAVEPSPDKSAAPTASHEVPERPAIPAELLEAEGETFLVPPKPPLPAVEHPAPDAPTADLPSAVESGQVRAPDIIERVDAPAAVAVIADADATPGAEASLPALRLRGVTKTFGETPAVADIDLTVPAGTFYGIVGPNGAGKTTTLSMIAGLLRPDRGEISIRGVDAAADPIAAKRMMGVLPDRLRTFDRLTGRQLLYYYGILRGLAPAVVESRTADLARAFDLTDALGRVVSDYSAGMTKKVMLAGAMIHSPRLLVLDEPFEAVDPVSSAVILDILSAYVAHGGTVVLSSHGMDLVERFCTRVAVIVAGQVLAEGTIDEVRGELTLEQRFIELAGGLSDVEGLEWLHTFSD